MLLTWTKVVFDTWKNNMKPASCDLYFNKGSIFSFSPITILLVFSIYWSERHHSCVSFQRQAWPFLLCETWNKNWEARITHHISSRTMDISLTFTAATGKAKNSVFNFKCIILSSWAVKDWLSEELNWLCNSQCKSTVASLRNNRLAFQCRNNIKYLSGKRLFFALFCKSKRGKLKCVQEQECFSLQLQNNQTPEGPVPHLWQNTPGSTEHPVLCCLKSLTFHSKACKWGNWNTLVSSNIWEGVIAYLLYNSKTKTRKHRNCLLSGNFC